MVRRSAVELACAVKKQRPKLRSDHRASPATSDLSNVHNGGACSHRSEERQEGGQCSITLLPEEMAERITSSFFLQPLHKEDHFNDEAHQSKNGRFYSYGVLHWTSSWAL